MAATEHDPLLGAAGTNRSSTDGLPTETDTGECDVEIEPSTTRIAITLGSIWVGVFFAAMDSTMMATLTTPIANSYHSFSILSWIASSYLIATAAVQPLTGRLTDIFGRKTGLLVCTTLFGLGNLACGLAQQGWVMILGRIISGAGGGGLFAIQTMVATDLVPLRKRGMWQGLGNIVFGAGGALGGAFGGLINQLMGWRMAFLIQVPFVLVSFILIIVVVRLPAPAPHAKSPWSRIDFGGAILLMSALILLLFALNNAGNVVPWTHPLVLTTFPLSVVLLVLFVIVEEKVAVEPIIRVRLFLNRTVTMACLTNWFTMMAMYALFFYAPIYFQLRGLSSSQRGAELISQGVGAAIGALAVGFLLKRTGRYYIINLLFSGMFVASTALLCTFDLGTPAYEPPIVLFVFGLGYGGMFVVALLALIAAIDHSEQAIATAAAYVFRSTGTSIGVTIASSVFQNTLKAQLWQRFGDLPDAAKIIDKIRDDFDLSIVPPGWRDGVRDSYMASVQSVWFTILVLSILAAATSWGMKEHKLHSNLARK